MQMDSDVETVFKRLSAGAAAIETVVRAATGVSEGEEVSMM